MQEFLNRLLELVNIFSKFFILTQYTEVNSILYTMNDQLDNGISKNFILYNNCKAIKYTGINKNEV